VRAKTIRRASACLLLLAALGLGSVVACGDEPTQVRTTELPVGRSGLPTPDQVVENGEHVITVQGVKKAILTAEQLYFYNQTGKVIGDTIQVNFFDDSGGFVSILTARTGEMEQTSQEMVARGDVFVRGRDATIKTEELHYDPRANRIFSDQPTVINQQGNVIRGKGVESDPALSEIKIRSGSAVLRSEPALGPQPATTDTTTAAGVDTARPVAREATPRDTT
jgi:LPS export ABC transporter protein LptC